MKKIAIIMTFVAAFATTSCSSIFGVSNSAAATSGSACAQALIGLRASQKAGTLSITNPTDLTNILAVISAYNMLQSNKSNKSFLESFTKGMVAGGSGIITNANVNTIISMLMAANTLSNVNSNNVTNNNGATATNALKPILSKM